MPMAFLHEHIILPLSDLIKGEQVHKYLRHLQEAESWTNDQLNDFQQERLRVLLSYVAKEVPFYRDWFLDCSIDPDNASLDQMPIVNKALMRQEGIDRFSAPNFPAKEKFISLSSGSTGEPFMTYETKLSSSVNTAAKLRTWYMAGYRLGDRYMKIANSIRHGKIKKLQDKINNCIYVPFYSMDDDTLKSILDKIEHTHPTIIRSYPIPLYLLAQYRNSHTGYRYTPRHIMTTGSTLPSAYRKEIEQAFGCDIIDSYSCEGTPNTYETPLHDGYHVCGYYGIIEVLDEQGHPVTDGIGRVVSTDLWNLAHPFIRYDTQDLVEVRGGRIQRIMGRQCEAIIQAQGTIYTIHNFSHFFIYEVPGVEAYQIVKRKASGITFRLVVNGQYTPDTEQYIIDFWKQKLHIPVSVELVDEIPLMNNNKRLTIVEE